MKAFVLEELKKYLVLNSNRLRTFDDARLEFVTYAEAKFGSTIHDTMPSESAARGLDDDAINSLASGTVKERGHHVLETVVPSVAEAIFRETALFTQLHAKVTARNANGASHGPTAQAMKRANRVKETEHPKESPKVPRVPRVHTRAIIRNKNAREKLDIPCF